MVTIMHPAGRHVTAHLVDLLLRRGYAFNRSADFDTVRRIKEQLCYVAYDYTKELKVRLAGCCSTRLHAAITATCSSVLVLVMWRASAQHGSPCARANVSIEQPSAIPQRGRHPALSTAAPLEGALLQTVLQLGLSLEQPLALATASAACSRSKAARLPLTCYKHCTP